MERIKDAWVDLIVTIAIVTAVTTGWEWARWVVLIYTPIMLLLKVIALFASSTIRRLKTGTPPETMIHLLYAVNVVALAAGRWWVLSAAWAVIWALSFIQARRLR